MCQVGRYELCSEGVVENIVHFFYCGAFSGNRRRLLDMIEGIEGW